MPLHPQIAAGLERQKALGWAPRRMLTPQEAREQAVRLKTPPPDEPIYSIDHTTFPGPDRALTLRIYRPRPGMLPTLMFFHGGGWVLGDLDTSDTTCRRMAKEIDCLVVSVEYRLAPEHPYPAALDDCYAATRWIATNGLEIDADPQRIAVSGVSSGGNLAASVCLMAREASRPEILCQLLVCPVLGHDFDTLSYRENAEGYQLERGDMIWFWQQYLGDSEPTLTRDPYAVPLAAPSFCDLPPAHIITAEYDPLRDEGAAYACCLTDAGIQTTYRCCEGMIHGVLGSPIPEARVALLEACSTVRAAFSNPG